MSQRLRILVVDDNPNMARSMVAILRIKGYESEMATSGRQALEKQSKKPFDCVLSDIRMPEMDGVSLCWALRSRRPIPVLLMTAYSSDALVQEGLDAGAATVLVKPVDIPFLLALFASLPDRLPEFLSEVRYPQGKVLMPPGGR
jgi:two-component system, OmpR family, response regulator ResD